jgi:predicted transcriptional regulator
MAKAPEPLTTSVTVRLPNDLLATIDRYAQEQSRSRANVIKLWLSSQAKTVSVQKAGAK